MTPQHLLEDGAGPNAGRRLQERHHFTVEDFGQPAAAPARRLLLRRQPRIVLDPIGRRMLIDAFAAAMAVGLVA
jgi:hypothetical protein